MYSLIRLAHGLTSLELRGIDFPPGPVNHGPFTALAGMPLRHLVLHVTSFRDDHGRSMEAALTSVLGNLPQLGSLDMTFPRYGDTTVYEAGLQNCSDTPLLLRVMFPQQSLAISSWPAWPVLCFNTLVLTRHHLT